MTSMLYKIIKQRLKQVKSYIAVVINNPSCEIHSLQVSRQCRLGKHLKILNNVKIAQRVSIGDHAHINANTMILSGNIGRYCSIGYNCIIGAPNHPTNEFTTSDHILKSKQVEKLFPFDGYAQPPIIGHDVWISSNSIILQGVTIGNGAIIAAGAVVTKDVEAGWLYAGVPAKKIRQRHDDRNLTASLGEDWFLQDMQTLLDKISS